MKEKIKNKIKQLNKQNVIEYFVILIITLLFCQNFLQMHYSSDTYVLIDLGYMQYPQNYFLLDGRLISTVVCYMAGILNIPIQSYIIGMDFVGIIFVATAIYLIFKVLEKIIQPKKIVQKVILIASCFVLILNQFVLEYLLFPESAVMCLGLLLNVIAIKIMVECPKHKYIKIFFTLLIAGLCYQGLLNIFPILAILVYIVKEIIDKREYKIKEKEFFIEMIKLAVIMVIIVWICMVVIEIGQTLLNYKQDRMIHLLNYRAVQYRSEVVLANIDEIWNNNMAMLPKHFSTITLVINFILLLSLRTKKEMVLQYLLLIIVAFAICIIPMYIFDTGVTGRVNVPLMMLWGASLIVLLAQCKIRRTYQKRTILIYVVVIISFIVNNIFIMQNITEHIAANRVDDSMGKTIRYALEKYEEETGNTVTKISYTYDEKPQLYAEGIKPIGSLTERKFACQWSILSAMDYYCDRKFQCILMPTDVKINKIPQGDYTEFSEDQLIFDGDTLYILVY